MKSIAPRAAPSLAPARPDRCAAKASIFNLRVSVDNVLDRRYYQGLAYAWSGGLERYGAPRRVLLSLNEKQ